jgi:hypothetical protein
MKPAAIIRQTLAAAAVAYHGKQAGATGVVVAASAAGGASLGLNPWLFGLAAACGAIVWGLRPAVSRKVAALHFLITLILGGIVAPAMAVEISVYKAELPAGIGVVRFLLALGANEYLLAVLIALGWQPVLPWAWEQVKARLGVKQLPDPGA